MLRALELAHEAFTHGEVPVGAVITYQGQIIATAYNRVENDADPTAHAEILCIRAACAHLNSKNLSNCSLYVTLEPCPMCAAAISQARLERLVFGAYDPKSGGVEHGACIFNHPQSHHKPEVIGGIEEAKCSDLLKKFFQEKR